MKLEAHCNRVRTGSRLALLAVCLFQLTACSDNKPVRIGFIGELTGNSSDLGEGGRNGVLLAIEKQNQNGGIAGHPIELIVRDTGLDVESAKKANQELLTAGVEIVIGPMTSAMVEALLPLNEKAAVVMLSPTASAAKFAGKDDQLFRINRTTRDNAKLFADYCLRSKWQRISAIANEDNRVFSESWLNEFKTAFEKQGGQLTSASFFDSKASSHTPLIQEALKETPDAIILIANAGDSARLAQQTRKQSSNIQILAAEWAATGQLLEHGGKAVDGLITLQQFSSQDNSASFVALRDKYRERYGRELAFASVLAHDAATVAIDALSRRVKGQALKETLIKSGPYRGLQETIQFDRNGDTLRAARFATIKDGQFVTLP
ncbi:ABC transporter substrate-binding protein [Azonexus sp. IMCC34839]|uniref:ABC transporter substrate-binding protein n=1 Tax=Azonexus sp. IMCC34839 TaxID=3133695 RepID=UPI00399AC7ED